MPVGVGTTTGRYRRLKVRSFVSYHYFQSGQYIRIIGRSPPRLEGQGWPDSLAVSGQPQKLRTRPSGRFEFFSPCRVIQCLPLLLAQPDAQDVPTGIGVALRRTASLPFLHNPIVATDNYANQAVLYLSPIIA
jgi:hypothetical protein